MQLQPVMGLPVATLSEMLKTSKEAEGRLVWTEEQWKNHKALAVLMKEQYRMQEPLPLLPRGLPTASRLLMTHKY